MVPNIKFDNRNHFLFHLLNKALLDKQNDSIITAWWIKFIQQIKKRGLVLFQVPLNVLG